MCLPNWIRGEAPIGGSYPEWSQHSPLSDESLSSEEELSSWVGELVTIAEGGSSLSSVCLQRKHRRNMATYLLVWRSIPG